MRVRSRLPVAATLVLALGSWQCGGEKERAEVIGAADDRPWFAESASELSLEFTHRSGHDGVHFLLPESASGGAALFDLDNDGFLDAYLIQSAAAEAGADLPDGNRLFHNVPSASGGRRFVDVTAGTGAGDSGHGMGVAAGDFDLDGDTDLYVTNVGPNVLLRNDTTAEGAIRFTDVSEAAGVAHSGFGSSTAFFDYDLDGDLDLYVVNYVVWSREIERECRNRLGERDYCDPSEYDAPAPDVLYRNDGVDPNGIIRFSDVSEAVGLDRAFGNGLGVVVADFDGDGRPDVFVSNDRMPDQLWFNRLGPSGDVRFSDEALLVGCAIDDDGMAKAGMGVDAQDIDGDGDVDLLVGNFRAESDSLFRNDGAFFSDVTAAAGLKTVSRPFTRFGLGFADFDNDGALDLYEAAGRVTRQERQYGADRYAEPNLLFRGPRATAGDRRFEEVTPRGGTSIELAATSRAVAFGDIDNDGGVDLLVANRDGRAHLLRNVVPGRGRWISMRVLGASGSDAIGAAVTIEHEGRRESRHVRSAYSYLASSDPRAHFGLGTAAVAGNVVVTWPDGAREQFGDLEADRVWTLRRGEGAPIVARSGGS